MNATQVAAHIARVPFLAAGITVKDIMVKFNVTRDIAGRARRYARNNKAPNEGGLEGLDASRVARHAGVAKHSGVDNTPRTRMVQSPLQGNPSSSVLRPQGGLAMADSRAHPGQTNPFTDKPGVEDGTVSRIPNCQRKCIKRLAPRYGVADKSFTRHPTLRSPASGVPARGMQSVRLVYVW